MGRLRGVSERGQSTWRSLRRGLKGKLSAYFPTLPSNALWTIVGVWCGAVLTCCRVSKLEIAAALYTPETLGALDRYRVHLRESRARLDERRVVAVEELERYGDGGGLTEIAGRYGDLVKEVENARIEIARLGE